VTGRVGYDPNSRVHLSLSAMRTGNLKTQNGTSALWFGNGWFIPVGSSNTMTFHANLVEADLNLRLPYVQVKSAAGYVDYGDDDPRANNHRDVYYYFIEGTHDWTHEFYSAARFSEVFAPGGFPIVGNGTMAEFLTPVTTEYWRLSMGLGYRFSPNLLVKAEYSFNHGQTTDGKDRDAENEFALEAAFKF
jgi:hypothetical protein